MSRYFVPTLVSILVKLLIDFRIYKPLLTNTRYPFFVVPLNMSDAVKITRSRTVKRKVASSGTEFQKAFAHLREIETQQSSNPSTNLFP